jgi:hypothetical protein
MPDTHATALFDFSLQRQDSTVAAKNFLTLFNPVGSGKLMSMGGIFVSYMATNPSPAYPLRGYRIDAEPTGGTLHAASEICKFDTQRFDPVAVIRSGNPTIGTLGPAFFSAAPGITQGTQHSSGIEQIDAPAGFNPFLLYPGEGIVVRQDVGNPGHYWNISVVWRGLKG